MNVVLHIERVVVRGLPVSAAEAPIVREALQAELTRLLSGSPPERLARTGSAQTMTAKPFDHRPGGGPAAVGRQTARAVHAAATGAESR